MTTPHLTVESTGDRYELHGDVTTVGRGDGVDISIEEPSVSRLHAELVRRGPHVYVSDVGLSTNGTHVNGRPVTRRVLNDGDVIGFGAVRARIVGLSVSDDAEDTRELRTYEAPELTRRESEVLKALCKPALRHEAFVSPATARDVADQLVVTEAAVKQHLLRLYSKFQIPEGPGRRNRLANEVISLGIVRPLPEIDEPEEADSDHHEAEVRRAG